MAQNRKFSIGWVLVSFFMVAGGVYLWQMILGALPLEREVFGYAAMFLGGFSGGLFASRANPSASILETVAGALLLFGGLGLATLITQGTMYLTSWIPAIVIERSMQSAAMPSMALIDGLFYGSLAGSAFLGGLITQIIAPVRMLMVAGAGFTAIATITAFLTLVRSFDNTGYVSLVVLGGVAGLLVGVAGAAVGWRLSRRRRVRHDEQIHRVFE